MSDKAILSDIPQPTTSGADCSPQHVTKRRRTIHHAQVIRADLDLLADPAPDPLERRACAAPAARRDQADLDENPGTASPSAAGADPGLGAGERKGRAGRSAVFRRRRARFARRLSARRPARRRGAARPPRASERRGLRQDPAPQRRRSRAARPPLRRRRPARARGEPLVALARSRRPAAQPRPRPDSSTRRPRLDLAVDPNGLAAEPEGLRRGGRSGFGSRQGRRPGVLRLPGRPSGRSRNPRALGVRHRHSPSGCAGRGPCR